MATPHQPHEGEAHAEQQGHVATEHATALPLRICMPWFVEGGQEACMQQGGRRACAPGASVALDEGRAVTANLMPASTHPWGRCSP